MWRKILCRIQKKSKKYPNISQIISSLEIHVFFFLNSKLLLFRKNHHKIKIFPSLKI